MGKTNIEWTDGGYTWNPWHGCHKVSPGCDNCYMFRDKARYGQNPDIVVRSKTTFDAPLRWKDPSRIFTCSWSDWFIPEADPWRDEAYEVIRCTARHTYQILTKRIGRAKGRFVPLPNIWLGVSVENRATKARIRTLRETPAALRFLSIEPLLEHLGWLDLRGIDWVILGGESGAEARPMPVSAARSVRDQCVAAGIPLFVKQWGEWHPITRTDGIHESPFGPPGTQHMVRIGKKAAGHLLDGKEWHQFPEARC